MRDKLAGFSVRAAQIREEIVFRTQYICNVAFRYARDHIYTVLRSYMPDI
jgi:hypothetical protein